MTRERAEELFKQFMIGQEVNDLELKSAMLLAINDMHSMANRERRAEFRNHISFDDSPKNTEKSTLIQYFMQHGATYQLAVNLANNYEEDHKKDIEREQQENDN